MNSFAGIMAQLRADLPKDAFQPQPVLGTMVLAATLTAILGGTWVIVHFSPPWYACLFLGFLIGGAYGTLGFLSHETAHGTVYRNQFLQDFVSSLGFLIFGFTATLWKVWHNKVHHSLANIPDTDPDSYGTVERLKKYPIIKFQFITGVGSGHWSSYLFFFYRFTYHSQIVLWILSKRYREAFKTLNRPRAIAESVLIFSGWIAMGWIFGWKVGLFAVGIPMILANFFLMSYIATNHFLRPLVESYNPLVDSMSVTTLRVVDFLHLNFSHHVEHHFFPGMNWRFTPLVRKSLLAHYSELYNSPYHWKAMLWLFKTPRLYEDKQTLVNPFTGKRVSIKDVEEKMGRHPFHPEAHPPVSTATPA